MLVLPPDKFKGGKADLASAKSCMDLDELMGMLMAREAERYETRGNAQLHGGECTGHVVEKTLTSRETGS